MNVERIRGNGEDLHVPFGASGESNFDNNDWFTDEEGDTFASAKWDDPDNDEVPDLSLEESFRLHFSGGDLQYEEDVQESREKTIRFFPEIATTVGIATLDTYEPSGSAASLNTEDIFMDTQPASFRSLDESEGSYDLFGEEDVDMDEDVNVPEEMEAEEDDEDAKIKKSFMYAAGGMGMMAVVSWGFQKLQSAFNKGNDEPPAIDVLQTGGDATTQAMQDIATSAAVGTDPSTVSAMAIQAGQANTFSASVASGSQSQSILGFYYMPGNEGAVVMNAAQ